MSYSIQLHTPEGHPIGHRVEITQGNHKAALVAAKIADARTGGWCDVFGPSGAFICSTRQYEAQREEEVME